MLKVHHLENSRSQRVVWLLEELGIEYELITYQRDPKTMLAPASLKRIHPLGKSPVVEDGSRVMAESGAIIESILEQAGETSLLPAAGSDARFRYRFWLHHAEGTAMPPLVMRLVFSRLDKPPVPSLIRPVARMLSKGVERNFLTPQIRELTRFWDQELARDGWFAGDKFTAADIQMSFPVLALESRGGVEACPNVAAFLTKIRERPAYQRTVARIGEFGMGNASR